MAKISNGDITSEENLTIAKELVMNLVEIGADQNACKTVMCLSVHGPSTSVELQTRCNIRQPDVSIAINMLNSLGLIDVVVLSNGNRGRPSQSYSLAVTLQEALEPFKEKALSNLKKINTKLSLISELTERISIMAE